MRLLVKLREGGCPDGVAGVQAGASVPGDRSLLTCSQAAFLSSGAMRNAGLVGASFSLNTHCPRLVGVGSIQQEVGAELDLEGDQGGAHDLGLVPSCHPHLAQITISTCRVTRETEGTLDRKESGENLGLLVVDSSAQVCLDHLARLATLEFR